MSKDFDEEEAVLLNCALYDPEFWRYAGDTLGDWADSVLGEGKNPPKRTGYTTEIRDDGKLHGKGLDTTDEDNPTAGGMTWEQLQAVARAVKDNEKLSRLQIANVTERDGDPDNDDVGNNAVFIDPETKTVIVGYMGTAGKPEWRDNFWAGRSGVTDTPSQMAAAQYFQDMMADLKEKYGDDYFKHVIATGHSKGGNLAMSANVIFGGPVVDAWAERTGGVVASVAGVGAAGCVRSGVG